MRILVIEDEISLNKTIIDNLNEFGYQTDSSENFKDGEYYANEYTIKSRPALNTSLYTVDLVEELPVGVTAFKHPALELEE